MNIAIYHYREGWGIIGEPVLEFEDLTEDEFQELADIVDESDTYDWR